MEYPVDVIKIDQTFIARVTESKASHAIVSKTIELAHLLDLTVVCEGVETAEQDRDTPLRASGGAGQEGPNRRSGGTSRDITPSPWDQVEPNSHLGLGQAVLAVALPERVG